MWEFLGKILASNTLSAAAKIVLMGLVLVSYEGFITLQQMQKDMSVIGQNFSTVQSQFGDLKTQITTLSDEVKNDHGDLERMERTVDQFLINASTVNSIRERK